MKKFTILFVFLIIALLLTVWNTKPGVATSEPEATYILGEGFDFATRNLSDPWDMSNFSDISQWLNHASPNNLTDIQVAGGLFSARTLGNSSYFFTLFPGYQPGVNSGKIGALFPINSSTYSCFYMAMKANWSDPQNNNFMNVFWAADKNFVSPGYQEWGQAYGYRIPHNQWQMYRINLNSPKLI